jgi:uncharacterized membrane protein
MVETLRDDEEADENAVDGTERNVEMRGSAATKLLLFQVFIGYVEVFKVSLLVISCCRLRTISVLILPLLMKGLWCAVMASKNK